MKAHMEETGRFKSAILHSNGLSKVALSSNLFSSQPADKITEIQWNAWLDLGITATKEGAGGSALGLFWIPSALDPKTMTRSYATNEENAPASLRPNYHLLPAYFVRDIIIENGCAVAVNLLPRNATNGAITKISANLEIMVAAGAFGSPTLLQRSGVGPKKVLQSAGISVKVDLPGVGNNLQDHAASLMLYGCKCHLWLPIKTLTGSPDANNIVPNSGTVATNATFAAEVQAEYYQNHTGMSRLPGSS